MAKIILSLGNKILREMPLIKERVTIGRGPYNDIVIDDLAISGVHAVIVTTNSDSFLEDLNSTNGTQVNGQPVQKHFLQNEDVIQLARYNISFLENSGITTLGDEREEKLGAESAIWKATTHVPTIQVLSGPSLGKKVRLFKSITTIGVLGGEVAVVTRDVNGYRIQHLEGENFPLVNEVSIGAHSFKLSHGDAIDLADVRMVFLTED